MTGEYYLTATDKATGIVTARQDLTLEYRITLSAA